MLFNHRINSDQAETLYVISQALTPYLESIVRGLSCSLARPLFLIPIHSVKVSTAFSHPSTKRCTMLIGIGKDLLVHVLKGSIHGNHH